MQNGIGLEPLISRPSLGLDHHSGSMQVEQLAQVFARFGGVDIDRSHQFEISLRERQPGGGQTDRPQADRNNA